MMENKNTWWCACFKVSSTFSNFTIIIDFGKISSRLHVLQLNILGLWVQIMIKLQDITNYYISQYYNCKIH